MDRRLLDPVRQTIRAMATTLSSWVAAAGPLPGVDPKTAGLAVLSMLDRFHHLEEFLGGRVTKRDLDTLTTLVQRMVAPAGTGPDGVGRPARVARPPLPRSTT